MAGNVEADKSLTIKIDATAPTVVYSGHPASYTADQTVSIACTASDAPSPPQSGIASTTCANITGPAYDFALG